jgi:hypothetical protein
VLLEKYGFLQSTEDEFDWQHWKIENGKIAESPMESYMNLKYKGDKIFSFKWEDKNSKENGSGFIYWDEVFYGKMSFSKVRKIGLVIGISIMKRYHIKEKNMMQFL